jgi:hypothetical protein
MEDLFACPSLVITIPAVATQKPCVKWTDELEGLLFGAILKHKAHLTKTGQTADVKWTAVVAQLIASKKFNAYNITTEAVKSKWKYVVKELTKKKDPSSNHSKHEDFTTNQTLALSMIEKAADQKTIEAEKKDLVSKRQLEMSAIEISVLKKRRKVGEDTEEADDDELEETSEASSLTAGSSAKSDYAPPINDLEKALELALSRKLQFESEKLDREEKMERAKLEMQERVAKLHSDAEKERTKQFELMFAFLSAKK